MSADTAKKRKTGGGDSQGDNDVEMSEGGTTMAAILAEMKDLKSRYTSLQNEMNGMKHDLEAKCRSLERGMDILVKENKWEYSAPDIPTSHWIDKGYDMIYAKGVENFLRHMKKCTFL